MSLYKSAARMRRKISEVDNIYGVVAISDGWLWRDGGTKKSEHECRRNLKDSRLQPAVNLRSPSPVHWSGSRFPRRVISSLPSSLVLVEFTVKVER